MTTSAPLRLCSEQLRQISCSVFRQPFHAASHRRTASRHLSAPLWGPVLKSYWPLRLKDFNAHGTSLFSSLIPLASAGRVTNALCISNRRLALPLRAVYRMAIGEWRRNRGQQTMRKGATKEFSANLGNFAFSKSGAK